MLLTARSAGDPDEPFRGKLDEAIRCCLMAIEESPTDLGIRHRLIQLAIQKGAYDIVIYQWMDIAELSVLAGDREASIHCYETILRLEETVQLGPSCRSDAVQVVRQLVATVKPEIYLRLGEYHTMNGSLQKAELFLRRSVELKPLNWDTHFALGKYLLESGRRLEATAHFQEMLRLTQGEDPEIAALAHEWLARAYRQP